MTWCSHAVACHCGRSSGSECTIGPYSAFEPCRMSSSIFLAFLSPILRHQPLQKAWMSLSWHLVAYTCHPTNFIGLLVTILLGVVDISILALLSIREATSTQKRVLISTSRAELSSLFPQAAFSRSFLRGTQTNNILIKRSVQQWTEMTHSLRQKSRFAHLSFDGTLLRFLLCIAVERKRSTDVQSPNQMESSFSLLNLYVRTLRKTSETSLSFAPSS